MTHLSLDEMISAARDATGLQDFGDPDMRDALSVAVKSFNSEARLTEVGVAVKRADIVRLLANRLRMQDAFNRFPQIAEEEIKGPLVIVGLPRTGTTKLQRMVARDPQMQSLPMWRLYNPAPLTEDWNAQPDPRIAAAEAWVEAMRQASPEAFAAHPMAALEADEDVFVMELTFLGYRNTYSFHTPSYAAYLDQQDFEPWYIWHRRLLQFTQFQTGSAGKHWLIKAPHHLGYLPMLFKYYPDAAVVHCHRDPSTTIPSLTALAYESRKMTSDVTCPKETGAHMLKTWEGFMGRYVRDRPAFEGKKPFVDLPYLEVVTDSLGAIRKVYDAAGLTLSDEAVAAMLKWESGNGAHDHGKFEYGGPEAYGLDKGVIDRAFGAYNKRFEVFQKA